MGHPRRVPVVERVSPILLSVAWVLAVLATAAGYLALGWKLYARSAITRGVQRQYEQHPILYETRAEMAELRREQILFALMTLPCWPLALAAVLLIDRAAARVPLAPAEAEQQIRQRDKRIAELERELRIR